MLLALIVVITSISNASPQQVFPSTATSWCLPGGWQKPADSDTLRIINSSWAVENWEITHTDLAFGADYGIQNNKRIIVTGYMYNQMLSYDPSSLEMALKQRTLNSSGEVNYEDFMLHFKVDTEFIVPSSNVYLSSWTSLRGIPWIFGWTNSPDHAGYSVYYSAPWNIYPWGASSGGGAAFVASFETFDSITLTIGAVSNIAGYIIVEYISSYSKNSRREASSMCTTCWTRLHLLEESTKNMSFVGTGTIRWKPPTNWLIATMNDGTGRSYGGGQFFGNPLVSVGGVVFAIRIRWVSTAGSTGPRLDSLTQRQWIRFSVPDGTRQVVPGWDPVNDRDGDGYVDDNELASLVNPAATARIRHESRAFTIGQMWSQRSSGCRTNVWDPNIATYISEYISKDWAQRGLQGAYNDDLMKMLGPSEFPIDTGGLLAEYDGNVNSSTVSIAYQVGFANILAAIAAKSKSKYIAGNISGVNLFGTVALRSLLAVLTFFLREQYLTAGIGMTGYFGVQKMWDTFAYAAIGKKTLIQGQLWDGAIKLIDATKQANWQRDIATILSVYYLINVPGSTSFQSWGNGYYYGSSNTYTYNYYKAGVPMNMAYQPTKMLQVDIGIPKTSISSLIPNPHREFMTYQTTTSVPQNGYTVIGNTSSLRLHHPELSAEGYLEVIPSYIYYLQRNSDHRSIPTTPTSCVLAREYTKGLVVYRTNIYGGADIYDGSINFLLSNITVQLPVQAGLIFRRVFYNGSLSAPVTSVQLGGYEGAVFVTSTATPTPTSTPSTTLAPSLKPSSTRSSTSRPVSSQFKLAWTFNFSTELSWDFNIYQGPFGSSSNTMFLKSNARVANNRLSLIINNASTSSSRPFASAGIGSWAQHSQLFGRWEVSAQFPVGFGVTGYIGLFPTDKSWPPEVDFAEVIGRQSSNLYLTQHFGVDWMVAKQLGTVFSSSQGSNAVVWTAGFHDFAVEWTPSRLVYFVDGVAVHNQTVLFAPTPMDIAVGTGVGDCGSWVDCPANAAANHQPYPLPAVMYVDYIRKYTYTGPTATPTSVPTSKPSIKPTASSTLSPSILYPTASPTNLITNPTVSNTANPTVIPTAKPTPSNLLSILPTFSPSKLSTTVPTPSYKPSNFPTIASPSRNPSVVPSFLPSKNPSYKPTARPTSSPSLRPKSLTPTKSPSIYPTCKPSIKPVSRLPSTSPSTKPTRCPTMRSTTLSPTANPSRNPSIFTTRSPSTCRPSRNPVTTAPTMATRLPTKRSKTPSFQPTVRTSTSPTFRRTLAPTFQSSSSIPSISNSPITTRIVTVKKRYPHR